GVRDALRFHPRRRRQGYGCGRWICTLHRAGAQPWPAAAHTKLGERISGGADPKHNTPPRPSAASPECPFGQCSSSSGIVSHCRTHAPVYHDHHGPLMVKNSRCQPRGTSKMPMEKLRVQYGDACHVLDCLAL
ncbi:unnamed protein product, partial [Urochloa humidicola]